MLNQPYGESPAKFWTVPLAVLMALYSIIAVALIFVALCMRPPVSGPAIWQQSMFRSLHTVLFLLLACICFRGGYMIVRDIGKRRC